MHPEVRPLSPIAETEDSAVSSSDLHDAKRLAERSSQRPRVKLRKSYSTIQERRSYRRSKEDQLDTLSLDGHNSTGSYDFLAASPYFPERSHGSAQRRSQRSPSIEPENFASPVQGTSPQCSSPLDSDGSKSSARRSSSQRSYHAPWVEDAASQSNGLLSAQSRSEGRRTPRPDTRGDSHHDPWVENAANESHPPLSARSQSESCRTPRAETRSGSDTNDTCSHMPPKSALKKSPPQSDHNAGNGEVRDGDISPASNCTYETESLNCQSRIESEGSFDSKGSKSVRFTDVVEELDHFNNRSTSPLADATVPPLGRTPTPGKCFPASGSMRSNGEYAYDHGFNQGPGYTESPTKPFQDELHDFDQPEVVEAFPRSLWPERSAHDSEKYGDFGRFAYDCDHLDSPPAAPSMPYTSFSEHDVPEPMSDSAAASQYAAWTKFFPSGPRGGERGHAHSVPVTPGDHDDAETAGHP